MERVYLESPNGLGLDMPTGERYDPPFKGAGYVEVDDLHAAVLKEYTGLHVGQRHFAADALERVCSACGFRPFKALAGPKCPRCGGAYE